MDRINDGPRVLLRRLREVMADPVSPQERLDHIVELIAGSMMTDVCSIYVMRADNALELYATHGLNRQAVHLTSLRKGEGLVGLIAEQAEALSLQDAQSHPAFAYKPETGEEIYHAFMGVPILRGGATLGVLVVQNTSHRVYTEEEIEALYTTAMLLAEIIAASDLHTLASPGTAIAARRSLRQAGVSISDGIGLGHVVLRQPRVVITNLIADDVDHELERLEKAIVEVREGLNTLLSDEGMDGEGEHRDVLETVRIFANDRGWLRRMREATLTGITAEAAVERVQSDMRAKMLRMSDPYLRERRHDLDDLAYRMMKALQGSSPIGAPEDLPENIVLVARAMGPAALLDYDRTRIRGLILEEGGPTSHVAIIARALGIPAVSEIENITGLVEDGDAIIVDGTVGEIQIRPPHDIELAYREKARMRARRQEQFRSLRDIEPITLDGEHIALNINAGLIVDLPHLAETGAEGIGLFRTELQFMVAERMPSASEQLTLYKQVVEAVGDKPIIFRTLDIGGDKKLPYMDVIEEENPALGWRALRIGLDRPSLLRSQVRALIQASSGRALYIMLPMVGDVSEFVEARDIIEREHTFLSRQGIHMPESMKVGVMVEIPSLIHQIQEIAAKADFLSVGSNDLMQYLFAVDRENRRVAHRFDALSPAFLRALKKIVEGSAAHDCPVSLCGEMGGRPLEAMALIGIGFRRFSMSAPSIGPVKAMLLKLDVGAVAALLDHLLKREGSQKTLRPMLADFAARHGIPV